MEITATDAATRLIQDRGGNVYVWFDDIGKSDWLMQRVAFEAPHGVEFRRYHADGFELHLDEQFTAPERIEIQRHPWPFRGLEVTGTGAGGAATGDSGGGGSWPGHGGGGDGGGGGHGGGGHGGH
jgi:hypothetical protein